MERILRERQSRKLKAITKPLTAREARFCLNLSFKHIRSLERQLGQESAERVKLNKQINAQYNELKRLRRQISCLVWTDQNEIDNDEDASGRDVSTTPDSQISTTTTSSTPKSKQIDPVEKI